MSCPACWAFGGSRSLSPAGILYAQSAAAWLLSFAPRVACGCALGADAALMRQARAQGLAGALLIHTAFGPFTRYGAAAAAPGTGTTSAAHAVMLAHQSGARVRSWAGGSPDLAFSQRLANRTRAVAKAATVGGVIVCEGTWGRGSALLARALLSRGLVVVAMSVPGSLPPAPPPCGESWRSLRPPGWRGAPVWVHGGLDAGGNAKFHRLLLSPLVII